MDYEKLHKDTIKKLHQMVNSGKITVETACGICADFVPESEDERIRKALKEYFINSFQNNGVAAILGVHIKDILIWLEKQGEHANFRNKIQIGDKVTRNEDGVLVNLSQLNRVAKKQGEQKPVDTAKQEMSDEEYCSLCMDINCDGCPYVDKSKHKEQKHAWSEEDEEKVKAMCEDGNLKPSERAWLKSLKGRYTWKPSKEQMEALWNIYKGGKEQAELATLYNDLKKLKG